MKKRFKKAIKNKKVFIALIVAGVLLLSLGTYLIITNKDAVIEEVTKKVVKPKPEEPPITVVDINSKTRPRAVMINNINVARPYQSGLNDAYIVYEMITEGGITRMLALFKDKDTKRVGPVRSARHYYLDYVLENDAIYTHVGYSPQAQSDISTLGISTVPDIWRDTSLYGRVSSEHTAFTSMELINQGVKNRGYRDEVNKELLLKYNAKEVKFDEEITTDANNVLIENSYSYVTSYKYNEDTKLYERYVNNIAHKDYITGEIFTAKNIIVYQVQNVTHYTGKGRQDLKNIGSGKGYYISNGKSVPITWEKTSRSSRTKYKLQDGTDLVVNDGNTYIQIQPVGLRLNIG